MPAQALQLLNGSPQSKGPFNPVSITLHARPGTDLWRKPSSPPVESRNAPYLLESVPIDRFSFAQVTIQPTKWTRLYDQGGLVIFPPTDQPESRRPWIKTGIEFHDDIPNLSTVATQSNASDWSLMPLPNEEKALTIRIEREVKKDGQPGPSLWVYLVKEGKRHAVREINWVFASAEKGGEFKVGVYVARPTTAEGDSGSPGDELEVSFKDLLVETV